MESRPLQIKVVMYGAMGSLETSHPNQDPPSSS
jgi:hypothetical protein